jgi:hypothetical protein
LNLLFAVVVGLQGEARQVTAPITSRIWIGSVEVPNEGDVENNDQRDGGNSETPDDSLVALRGADDWIEDRRE